MVYQLNKYHVVNKPSPLFVCVCVCIFSLKINFTYGLVVCDQQRSVQDTERDVKQASF